MLSVWRLFCFAQIYIRTVKNAKIKLECVWFNIVSFQKFLSDETFFYSCSLINNLSKKPPFEKYFLERRFMFWKQVWRNLKRQRRYFLMKQVRLSPRRPTTLIWKTVCRLIQKNIRTCVSWLMTPKTEDWCLKLRKEDFVSDSQNRTAMSDALLQVSWRRNKNISCEIATVKNKWHLS